MSKGRYGAWTTLQLHGAGKRVGFINVPFATTRSAYGNLRVPIGVIAHGSGPSVLITGGNHGDEFEGQISASRVFNELEPSDVIGRILLMPAANLPAVQAATRLSPLDQGNLNTAFPGDGTGPTAEIARFIDEELLPELTAWIDLHSGGSSLVYLPAAAIHQSEDLELDARSLDLLRAFGGRTGLVFRYQHQRAASSAAQRHRVPYVYGEFGGGGCVTPEGLRLAFDGTLRVLAHLGLLINERKVIEAPASMRILETVTGANYLETRRNFIFAERSGVIEPACDLGKPVSAGQQVGVIHHVEELGISPTPVRCEMGGVLIARRHFGRVEPGDCLGQIALPRSDLEVRRGPATS